MKIPAYSFAFAGLLLSSLAVAQDQPQNAFYPSQSWQVTKNPYQAVSTVEYCGLSNRFNNGFDFQIIGSEKWIDAVDIDFAQDVFVSGKEYSVDFAVPGEMQASLLGEARNAQTLTIDISGRKDLYNAVKQVAVTDLKIEGNEFRFYLVGIAGRIPEFEQCMADIAAPDSSALAGAVPPAPVEADPIDTSASPDAAASLPDESLLVGAPDALPDSTIEAAQMEEDQRRSLSEEGPIALAPPPVERVQPDQVGVLAERLSPQEEPETDAGPEEGTDDAGLSVSASMNDVEEPVLAKPQERERFTQAIDQQLRRADVPEPLSENPVSANPGLEDDGLEDEEPETAEAESAPLQPEKLPPILKTEETASESQEEVAEKPAPRPGFYTPADLARLASGQDVDPLETMPEEFRPVSQNTDPASGNYPANDPANDIELPPIDIEELTAQPPVEPQEMANETPTEMTGAGEIIVEVHEDPSEGVALADKEAQAAASGEETAIIPETPDTGSGIRARTPEISVTRETQRIEADFTRFPEEARS